MEPLCVRFHLQDKFCFQVIEDLHEEAWQGWIHKVPGAVRPRLD
jgi:lipopolysaccharide transport system ATP-binding protein